MSSNSGSSGSSVRPLYPAYAQLPLQNLFPFDSLHGSSFSISVVPQPLPFGEIPRIWAFVTVTENKTNMVTIQQPQ